MANIRPTFEFDLNDKTRLLSLMDEYAKESGKSVANAVQRTSIQWLKSARAATPISKKFRKAIRNKKRRHGAADAYMIQVYNKAGDIRYFPAPAAKVKQASIKYQGAARHVWSGLLSKLSKGGALKSHPLGRKFSEFAFRRGALPQVRMASTLRYIDELDKKHHIDDIATTKAARELDYQIRVMRGEIEKKSRKK